jgi:hypothetical protein
MGFSGVCLRFFKTILLLSSVWGLMLTRSCSHALAVVFTFACRVFSPRRGVSLHDFSSGQGCLRCVCLVCMYVFRVYAFRDQRLVRLYRWTLSCRCRFSKHPRVSSQNCRQMTGSHRRSILHAAKSSQMQCNATNQFVGVVIIQLKIP